MTAMSTLAKVRNRIEDSTKRWARGSSLAEIRQDFENLVAEGEPPPLDEFSLGGMSCAWFGGEPDTGMKRAVLFCHGGGFQIGSLRSHRGLMARIASAAETPVLGFDYRLAPEARYPAAHEDTLQTYALLCRELGDGASIALIGDSAGGNLALATAIRAIREGLPKPACLVLVSPWLDLSMRGNSYTTRADLDFFSKPAQLRAMARTYLGRDGDPSLPACSPLHDDLAGLPPVLVHAGDHDITLDDSNALAALAARQDIELRLRVWPGMFHHFQLFDELPEAKESIAEIGTFLGWHLTVDR